MKKLTDKVKVERAKAQMMRALEEIKNNSNRTEVLGFVTGQIAHTFALLDADKDDQMGIVFVAVAILDELEPRERKTYINSPVSGVQLELGEQ